MGIKAFIAGCAGLELSAEEAEFFTREKPWGFILFARNIDTPDQVRALTAALRATVGRPDAPILIDQEGGRVQRLRPPHWFNYPPGRLLGDIYRADAQRGLRAAWLQSRLIAFDLTALGINVDCLPVLDVPVAGANDVIGDRAYGFGTDEIAALGRAAAEGLMAGGVLPIIKHIPGHGRAMADSHLKLPVVDTDRKTLAATDFVPFRELADMPMAMTAHVVYSAYDAERPATLSPLMFDAVIRGDIGFDGLVMSDDLSMHALSGDFADRTQSSFEAGCDVVLHCNGSMAEMTAVAAATPVLEDDPARRADAAMARLSEPDGSDEVALRAEFEALTATLV